MKLGESLNDPKILSHMPTLSTPYIILPILKPRRFSLVQPLLLHDVLVSKIRQHLRPTHMFLSRNRPQVCHIPLIFSSHRAFVSRAASPLTPLLSALHIVPRL